MIGEEKETIVIITIMVVLVIALQVNYASKQRSIIALKNHSSVKVNGTVVHTVKIKTGSSSYQDKVKRHKQVLNVLVQMQPRKVRSRREVHLHQKCEL